MHTSRHKFFFFLFSSAAMSDSSKRWKSGNMMDGFIRSAFDVAHYLPKSKKENKKAENEISYICFRPGWDCFCF